MKFKVLLPILALTGGVIFYSCSKDSNSASSTPDDKVIDTYYPGTTMTIKQLAIYTKDGVTNDVNVIQSFMSRRLTDEVKSHFYVGQSSVTVPQDNSTILKFLDNNRVNVYNRNLEITGYKDSLMLVSEYTSSQVPIYGISTCSDLFAKIPGYTPLSGCVDSTCTTYRATTPIITNGNSSYFIPLLTYAVSTKDCTFANSQWPMVNVLSNTFQSSMVAGDSVLVQYATLPLVKKVD